MQAGHGGVLRSPILRVSAPRRANVSTAAMATGGAAPPCSLAADGELPEGDAELDAGPLAGEGERHLPLGDHLRLGRLAGPGGGAGVGVAAEELVDVRDLGELAVAVADLGAAGGQAAPLRLDRHPRLLAVVAGDR